MSPSPASKSRAADSPVTRDGGRRRSGRGLRGSSSAFSGGKNSVRDVIAVSLPQVSRVSLGFSPILPEIGGPSGQALKSQARDLVSFPQATTSNGGVNDAEANLGGSCARQRDLIWWARLANVTGLANQQVYLAHIETGLAIVFSRQLQKGESILVGSKGTVDRLVQIDEAALDDEKNQRWFW